MSIVYQNQRSSTPSTPNSNRQTPGNDGDGLTWFGLMGLFFAGCALYFIGLSIYTAIVSLGFPSVIKAFVDFKIENTNWLILILEGAVAGFFIGCMRKAFSFKSKFGKDFLTELYHFKIHKVDLTFLPTLILTLLVGSIVGWVAGGSGAVGSANIFTTGYSDIANNITHDSYPIVAIVAGGGAGGAGSGQGFFGGGFFWVALIIIVFVVQGSIAGALSGLTFSFLMAGLTSGALKGGSFETVFTLISNTDKTISKRKSITRAAIKGMAEGAVVGAIVGFIQGLIVTIAFRDKK